jgi:hypothetical protein
MMTFRKLKGDHTGTKLQTVAVRQNSLDNGLPVHLRTIGALKIIQDEIGAVVGDSGMMP